MKRNLFNSWIQALRSEDYYQTYETLTDGNGFCCLGVLGDIHPNTRWECGSLIQPYTNDYGEQDESEDTGELTDDFRTELNLPTETHNHLAHLNDKEDFTFGQIADWLESIAGTEKLPIEEDA